MGCEHCSHPLWAGIRCSQCGRWYDECRICGKRGNLPCEECMKTEPSEALKQAWDTYQQALKEFDCPRCGHCCRREWQGLTDDETMHLMNETYGNHWADEAHIQRFRKAIEAALKEKNNG